MKQYADQVGGRTCLAALSFQKKKGEQGKICREEGDDLGNTDQFQATGHEI